MYLNRVTTSLTVASAEMSRRMVQGMQRGVGSDRETTRTDAATPNSATAMTSLQSCVGGHEGH